MSPIKRAFRKVPLMRAAALAHARQQREEAAKNRAAYNQSVMCLIGTMTVTWAGVERMLDELIAFHQQRYTDLSSEHPKSLSNKLEYIKKHLEKNLAYTYGARNFCRRLRLEGKRLGNERHQITHGVLRRSGSSLVWRSQRVVYEKAVARVVHRDIHNDELVSLLKQIGEYSQWLSPRVWLMIGNDPARAPGGDIEKIHRELSSRFPPVEIP